MINGVKECADGQPWPLEELAATIHAGEFENTLKSIYAKKLRVINAMDKRINETLRMKPIYVDMNLDVKKVLAHINDALDDLKGMNATKLVLYYCGHGHETYGGWVTHPADTTLMNKDKNVHVHDILNTIERHEYDAFSVEITSESCFSGQICH